MEKRRNYIRCELIKKEIFTTDVFIKGGKFNNLKRRYGIPTVSNLGHDKIIFNYSHRALTEAEKMVLARGLRFCLPQKSVDSLNVKCSFEMLYRDLLGLDHSLSSEDKDRCCYIS